MNKKAIILSALLFQHAEVAQRMERCTNLHKNVLKSDTEKDKILEKMFKCDQQIIDLEKAIQSYLK